MVNVAKKGKRRLIICIACAAVCALLIAPTAANAFWYVHTEDNTENSTSMGVIEVLVTLDSTAQGGDVHVEEIFVPSDATVADALEEAIVASNDQNGLDAIHSYEYESFADYLADEDYTIEVYHADTQEAGTHTTYDTEATGTDVDVVLERFDSVVFTLK